MRPVANLRSPGVTEELLAHAVPVLIVGLGGAGRQAAGEYRTATQPAPAGLPPVQEALLDDGACIAPLIKSGRNPYQTFLFVGRASTCDFILRDPSVSKMHAIFEHTQGSPPDTGWTLRDNGSHNGTWIGDRKLPRRKPVPLAGGESLVFGVCPAYVILPAELRRILASMGLCHA